MWFGPLGLLALRESVRQRSTTGEGGALVPPFALRGHDRLSSVHLLKESNLSVGQVCNRSDLRGGASKDAESHLDGRAVATGDLMSIWLAHPDTLKIGRFKRERGHAANVCHTHTYSQVEKYVPRVPTRAGVYGKICG